MTEMLKISSDALPAGHLAVGNTNATEVEIETVRENTGIVKENVKVTGRDIENVIGRDDETKYFFIFLIPCFVQKKCMKSIFYV